MEIIEAHRHARVRRADRDTIAAALLEGVACSPVPGKGRGTLSAFPLAGGTGLVRRYRRGGLAGKVLRDSYLFDNRPRREFELHRALAEAGLPVAPLLGVVWEKQGPRYRGAIATEQLDAPNLLEWLGEDPADANAMLAACGAAIRKLHDAGVAHADLQVKNILVSASGPVLIDFDNARRQDTLPPILRQRNLLRLRRSFERHGLDAHFTTLMTGYGPVTFPGWLDTAYRIRGRFSDWTAPEARKEP